ncbi:hypothetical protein ABPG72_007698 [Tetrahymena utriculariae]
MRVLSSDYKTCLNIREEIVNLKLLNCKRLDNSGKCVEAIDGIEIIDGRYSFTDQYFQNDRCAIASKNYGSCLMPRFGYILNVKEQRLYKDHSKYPTFCQLYDSFLEKCIKHFDYFLPSEASNGLSVYLNNFINADLVDSLFKWMFQQEFIAVISNNSTLLQGIFKQWYLQVVQQQLCLKKNGFSCEKFFIPKCVMYDFIEEKQVCIQCQPFYRIKYFECIPIENCQMLHPLNPNICIACKSPYQLNKIKNICEKPLQSIDSEVFCELYSMNGKCLLCKQNELNYLPQGYCIPRQKSQFCKNQDPNNDSCLTLECINVTYYAQINSEDFSFNYKQPDIKEIAFNNLIKYRLVAQNVDGIQCIQCQPGYYEAKTKCIQGINNCKVHESFVKCLECEEGYISVIYKNNQDIFFKKCEKNQNIRLIEKITDCQQAYYDKQNRIICETCRMRFISYNNTCFKDKLYQPSYFQGKLQKITKKCMSIINQSSSGCDVNIQDQIVINQPSIYGEINENLNYRLLE